MKKETEKKIAYHKVCLQQNLFQDFQKFQDCMNNLLYPSGKTISVSLVSLSDNTLEDSFVHIEGNMSDF